LVGQTELRETLKLRYKAIWQRVGYALPPSGIDQRGNCSLYCQTLATVKAPGEIFTHAAVGVINEYCEVFPDR